MDDQWKLTEYLEKPRHRFFVSMGIYCFEPEVCDLVEPGECLAMPDLIHRLRDEGKPVMCYQEDCHWLDIGRPDDYATAVDQFRRDRGCFLPQRSAA